MATIRRQIVLAMGVMVATVSMGGCTAAADPTQVEQLEEGVSLSSAANSVYDCLTERGWDPKLLWDGGIEVTNETVPKAQLELYNEDSAECWAEIDNRIASMQPDAISEVYAAELATRECLIDRGFDVGTPPSEQKYIDTFHGMRWSAYGHSNVNGVANDDTMWRAVNQACPQPAWSLGSP